MAVHSDGTGTSWEEAAPDIDQPLGLSYRELQDIRKGVRKRIEQEHATFADNTVGGIHVPGGAAILGIEDGTATIVADGTLKGHGLVWDNTSRIWCATAVAGASTTGDWTLVLIHPDKQWDGGDITWAGAHEFDASVDITGNVAVDGDFSVDGTIVATGLVVDGTANLNGGVVFSGNTTVTFDPIAGETGPIFKIFGDWSTRANNTTYTARTDGIVVAQHDGEGYNLKGFTPTGTEVAHNKSSDGNRASTITFPVKGGDTWDVSGGDTILWLPFGDNT